MRSSTAAAVIKARCVVRDDLAEVVNTSDVFAEKFLPGLVG